MREEETVEFLKIRTVYKDIKNKRKFCRHLIIIFWYFLMFDQIFPSPQVKRSVIITNKHGIQVYRRCSILTGVLRNFAKSTETTRARARPPQNRSPRPATAPKKRPRPRRLPPHKFPKAPNNTPTPHRTPQAQDRHPTHTYDKAGSPPRITQKPQIMAT